MAFGEHSSKHLTFIESRRANYRLTVIRRLADECLLRVESFLLFFLFFRFRGIPINLPSI